MHGDVAYLLLMTVQRRSDLLARRHVQKPYHTVVSTADQNLIVAGNLEMVFRAPKQLTNFPTGPQVPTHNAAVRAQYAVL